MPGSPNPPAAVGAYRLGAPLGQGGMGVVYRGERRDDGSAVAIKTVRVRHPSLLAGIRREIRALMLLDHPGVVRVLEEGVIEGDGVPWYAMELLDGYTLRDHLSGIWSRFVPRRSEPTDDLSLPPVPAPTEDDRKTEVMVAPLVDAAKHPQAFVRRAERFPAGAGRLPEALLPIRRLCATLAFLHGEGIVHRDLKPENVFLRADGMPVLVDFGIASRVADAVGREALEVGGLSTGTAGYMAPEQIAGERVDARADLYAVGCLLYEAVTGVGPFGGVTHALLSDHLRTEAAPPSQLVEDLPAELNDLIERLLRKHARERLGHAADVVTALAPFVASPKLWNARPARAYLYRPEIVGRDDVCDALDQHLKRARDGRGALCLLGGESGVGKTTVATEATRLATIRGFQVVTGYSERVALKAAGAGHSGTAAAAFHPLRGLFEHLFDRCLAEGDATTERLLGARAKILGAVEPLLERLPGLHKHSDPAELPVEAARGRLFAALAETLAALVAERPLLCVLDDLQWADELTLSFLATLPNGLLDRKRLLLLGTYRSDERSPELDALLARPRAAHFDLGRLDRSGVGRMVNDMLALPAAPPELVQFLTDHSEGNPFFVAEYLRAAVADQLLLRDAAGQWQIGPQAPFASLPVPGMLREIIGRRLDVLSPDASVLSSWAAALGREFSPEVLSAAWSRAHAQATVRDTERLLDELVRSVVLDGAPGGRLRFVHDKLRESAYERSSPDERRTIHRHLAHTIEAAYHTPAERAHAAGRLAHHFAAAGIDEAALRYLEEAGRHALATAAYGEAADSFQRALALDAARPQVAPERRANWEEGLGTARFALGDLPTAEQHARRALVELGQKLPDQPLGWGAVLLREVGRQALHRLGLHRAPSSAAAGERLLHAAQAVEIISHRYYYISDSLPFLTSALLSVNLAETAGLGWRVPRSYAWLGYIAGLMRAHPLAARYFTQARQGAERLRRPSELAFARAVEAIYHCGYAKWEVAERCGVEAIDLSRLADDPQMLELAITIVGHAEYYMGRAEAAYDRFAEVLRRARARAHLQHANWGLFAMARSLVALGKLDDALPLLEEARAGLVQAPELDPEIICWGLSAVALHRRGDESGAARYATETLERIRRSRPIGFSTREGYDAAAEVLLGRWQKKRAAGLPFESERQGAREAISHLGKLAFLFPMAAPLSELRQAECAALDGKRSRAQRLLERAEQSAVRLAMPLDAQLIERAGAAVRAQI